MSEVIDLVSPFASTVHMPSTGETFYTMETVNDEYERPLINSLADAVCTM